MSSKLDQSLEDIIKEDRSSGGGKRKGKGKGKGQAQKANNAPYQRPAKGKGKGKGGGSKGGGWGNQAGGWGSGGKGKGGGKGGGKRSLIISNIPNTLSWQDLKGAFSAAGTIEFCQVYEGGKAEITYIDGQAARNAVDTYDGGDLNGRRIRVQFA